MVKISNVKQFEKDGRIYFSYTRDTGKDVVEVVEPLYDDKGELNQDLASVLRYAQKKQMKSEKKTEKPEIESKAMVVKDGEYGLLKKDIIQDEIVTAEPEKTKEPVAETPKADKVNTNWFKKNKGQIIKGVVAGVLIAGAFLLGTKFANTDKSKTEEPTTSTIESMEDEPVVVENAVTYISYEEALEDLSTIGQDFKNLGYSEVSQRSLNSVYFMTNYTKFEEDTINDMIENGVVSSDPMTIVTDSLEALSVCQDQTGKALTGQDKEIIDLSMFCTDKEDVELLTHANESLNSMKNGDNENGKAEFMSYYHYLNNEETTEFPILYNEANDGANYLLNQGYGGAFCIGGSFNGIEDSYTKYLEENTGMNDFSTIYKNMEKCLVGAQTEEQQLIK